MHNQAEKKSYRKGDNPFIIQSGKLKLADYSYRLGWTEESFVFGSGNKEVVGRTFNFKKIIPIAIFILLFFSLLLARAAWLQLFKGDYYYQMAEGNRLRTERIEAKRGVIYDRNLTPLVNNQANFILYMIPADLPKDKQQLSDMVDRLSVILSERNDGTATTSAEAIKQVIRAKIDSVRRGTLEAYQPLLIADDLAYEQALLLKLELTAWNGIAVTDKARRHYDFSALSLSHLLGYTGKISPDELKKFGTEYTLIDYIGKSGLEYFYENELKGMSGRKQIEVDALGREKKEVGSENAQDGNSLVLALDTELQKKLEESLTASLAKLKLKRASAIMLNPKNGEILAMVSLPAYDNNLFARGISSGDYDKFINNADQPLFDRAVSGEFPSGSTIKPVMAAAALEENVINQSTTVLSTGGIRIGEWFFPDWRAGGHGVTDVRRAIAESVNTFFYYIGGGYQGFNGLGVDRIVRYEKMFGLGEQTGIDLPSEATGFLPSKQWKEETKGESWYIGDTYHLSIGQGDLLVTPLQVAAYTAVFANGGKLYRPHLVKEIISGIDKTAKKADASPVRQDFISPANIEIVREGMRQTVTSGSARSLMVLPVEAAGKTGTAQWSTKKNPHAWFTGFAPYDDPQVVISILIEEGKEGSTAATPVALEVLKWYFSNHQANLIKNTGE